MQTELRITNEGQYFERTSLEHADFRRVHAPTYTSAKMFSKSIDALSQSMTECSERESTEESCLILRAQARMLVDVGRLEAAEAVYRKIIDRGEIRPNDYYRLGKAFLNSADALKEKTDEDNCERELQYVIKAVEYFREGIQVVKDTGDDTDLNLLVNWLMDTLGRCSDTYDWQSVLREIENLGVKDAALHVGVAKVYIQKKEFGCAVDVLLKLFNGFGHYSGYEDSLIEMNELTVQIGKEVLSYCLVPVLLMLEEEQAFLNDMFENKSLGDLHDNQRRVVFNCWLSRLYFLIESGLENEASTVALAMEKEIPGALDLFSAPDPSEVPLWKEGAYMCGDLVHAIRDSGVRFGEDGALADMLGGLKVNRIRSAVVEDLIRYGAPALCTGAK